MEDIALPQDRSIFNNRMLWVVGVVFIVITGWWLTVIPLSSDALVDKKNLWSSSYEIISFLGAVFGIIISRSWGGYKSIFGRAILAFSFGLLLQTFGQVVYNYYTLVAHIQAPYPSLGDVGYFGSIIAYIYGVLQLGHATGLKLSLRSGKNVALSILLPMLMLVSSYLIFLRSYSFSGDPLTTFLDFGYPLGQAVYVSIAMLVFYTTRKFLGGVMKQPVILLLIALVIQYLADFDFLFKANHGTWYAGGPGDYLYAVSYLLMSIAIISVGQALKKLNV